MSALDRIRASGVEIELADDGRLRIRGELSAEQRTWIGENKMLLIAELRDVRPIVEYRFANDPPHRWYILLGRPGESYDDAAGACRRKFAAAETQPRAEPLPDGFPFRLPDDGDGEFKNAAGEPL